MTEKRLRFVIVASTAGSVMNQVLKNDFFRERVHSVVTDRECEALQKAKQHGIPTETFLERTVEDFSSQLLQYLVQHRIDYVFSYYTNFYAKTLRQSFEDRIINFHPSILPAFKGMDGFGDNVAYHARFVGNTVEFIEDVMDEGKIIMQTVCPLDPGRPVGETRHLIFEQQCKSLLQIAKWLSEGRVRVEGRRVLIEGARFDDFEFSPSLDFRDAVDLHVKMPVFADALAGSKSAKQRHQRG